MRPNPAPLALLLALLAASAQAAEESSISCDGGRVAVGDSKLDLLGKCGRPALVDRRAVDWSVVEAGAGTTVLRQARAVVEEWSYNFGPQRFLMFVTLADGKVAHIERGGYGFPPARLARAAGGRATCDASALHVGDRKLELLARCGEPALREPADLKPPTAPTGGTVPGAVAVEVERWTFDFGPQAFVHTVVLEDGRVTAVERGGYGYAP